MANNLTPFIPEVWAGETLRVLKNNLVLGAFVNRNFENEVQTQGNVINIPRPQTLSSNLRGLADTSDMTNSDAEADNVTITLSKHRYVSLRFPDAQVSVSRPGVVQEWVEPAAVGIAEDVETDIASLFTGFTTNVVNDYVSALVEDDFLNARRKLLNQKLPMDGRTAVFLHPDGEADALAVARLTEADITADGGAAMQQALLGRRFNMRFFTTQKAPKSSTQVDNAVMHPDAISLAVRPLAAPTAPGAEGATVSEAGYSIRVVRSYDGRAGYTRLTFDILYGLSISREVLGCHLKSLGVS